MSASSGYSQGYDISYTSSEERGCGGEVEGTRGAVTSPGFPAAANRVSVSHFQLDLYALSICQATDCTWTVSVPMGQQLQLRFTEFTLGQPGETGG